MNLYRFTHPTAPCTVRRKAPAPWSVVRTEYCDGHILTILDAKGFRVARTSKVSTINEPDDGPELLANARLIAAAPELLQALQTLRDECQKARKYIVISDDNGYAAYNATAEALMRADKALRSAT